MTVDRRNDILPKIFIVFLTVAMGGLWTLTIAVSGKGFNNERRIEVVEKVFENYLKENDRRLSRIEHNVEKIFDKVEKMQGGRYGISKR